MKTASQLWPAILSRLEIFWISIPLAIFPRNLRRKRNAFVSHLHTHNSAKMLNFAESPIHLFMRHYHSNFSKERSRVFLDVLEGSSGIFIVRRRSFLTVAHCLLTVSTIIEQLSPLISLTSPRKLSGWASLIFGSLVNPGTWTVRQMERALVPLFLEQIAVSNTGREYSFALSYRRR